MKYKEILNKAEKVYPINLVFNEDDFGITRSDYNDERREGYVKGYQDALADKDIVEGVVSPFTGGKVKLLKRKQTINFRGEEITFSSKYYKCVDTGHEYVDATLEADNLWVVFRKYWEKKGVEYFSDIDGYKPIENE